MLVLLQLVDVRRPRLIDFARDGGGGATGELRKTFVFEWRLPIILGLDWSRFLLTGGKYMILSDWFLQVQCNYWSGNLQTRIGFYFVRLSGGKK